MAEEKAWTGKTGGTPWMQRSLIMIFSRIDTYWFYPVVAVWILFYICAQREGRRGIYYYWHHCMGRGVLASLHHTYWTYFRFGTVILDRFAAYSGKKFAIRVADEAMRQEMEQRSEGTIVLSSHIGHQELAGYSFPLSRPMHCLIYLGDTATVNQNRERLFGDMGLHFIPVETDGSHVFRMHEVLSRGEILSIHGDRMFLGGRTLETTVLGEVASFPEGPFRVAAAEEVPVYCLFLMQEHHHRYTLYVRRIATGAEEGTTREKAMRLLLAYVHEIEQMVQRYPHQWYHFYRFFGPVPTKP